VLAALLACVLWFSPTGVRAQDAVKALGMLQSILGGAKPAPTPSQPAAPANPAGAAAALLGNALGAGASPAANRSGDVFDMLLQSVEQIDEAKEIQIGKQVAAVLLGSKPLSPDMAMQRYVNQLGRWISLQSSRPNLPWTFAVIEDEGFNAFAAPGGYVFVTTGLMNRLADEAELAGILAHEITHVTAKHHLVAMSKAARAGLLTQAIGSQLKNNLGGQISGQLLALSRDVYTKGLDQSDEFDADRSGVTLAARAGFDPYGLLAVLQQLRTATPDDNLFALSLSTHPAPQLRLNQLEAAMGNRLDVFSGQRPVRIAQRLQATPK
jgi:predicted Zn-dependent protease